MRAYRVLCLVACCVWALAWPAQAAMYKWVDENGNVNYGDSVPPKYANKVTDRSARPGSVKWDKAVAAADGRASEQDLEKRRNDEKQAQERKRQDTALMSTYSSEAEIEQARQRELRRTQETLKVMTTGLAASNAPEDKQRLDALMTQSRKDTDSINARFDAQKARYRELTGTKTAQAAAASTPPTATGQPAPAATSAATPAPAAAPQPAPAPSK